MTIEQPVACRLCSTPTWDHHGVCARCRGVELTLERSSRKSSLIAEVAAAYASGDGTRRYDTG